jgi:hypothetical protein
MLITVTMHASFNLVGMANANHSLMDINVNVQLDGVVMSVRHMMGILSRLSLSQDQAIFYLMMQTFIKSKSTL